MQINRFDDRGSKIRICFQHSRHVLVPYFTGSGIASQASGYEVSATIYHIGPSRLHGHYRTALCFVGYPAYVSDDGIPAQDAAPADLEEVAQNSYVIFLRQLSRTG